MIREKYKIISRIGHGGMGVVYKAEHLVFEELRALKVLIPQLAHDETLVRHLRQEARIARRLSHPNAVRTEDLDRAEDGRVFIVMEYVEGRSLRDIIQRQGALPVSQVIKIAQQLCSALDCAHSLGMIHRDIKPDNVFLVPQPDERDLVKVLDFGIAKLREGAKEHGTSVSGITMTRTGFVVGTSQYMSPEQAMGKPGDQLDGRSDLYSVGVLLYEALTGLLPFKSDTLLGFLVHHISTLPLSPLAVRPDLHLPEALANIVMKALEKDPGSRFQSAQEMILAVNEAAESYERETVTRKVSKGPTRARLNRPVAFPPLSPPPPAASAGAVRPSEGKSLPESISRPGQSEGAGVSLSREVSPQPAAGDVTVKAPQPPRIRRALGFIAREISRRPARIGLGVLVVFVLATWATWVRVRKPVTSPQPGSMPISVPAQSTPPKTVAAPQENESPAPRHLPPTETENRSGAAPRAPEKLMPAEKPRTRQGSGELTPAQQAELKDKLATATFYMERNDYDSAIVAYQEALRIDPSSLEARDGIQRAQNLRQALKTILRQ